MPNNIAKSLEIEGIVQGVGFRPFVYQLANQHGLMGEVSNTPAGVSIHVEGKDKDIESFCKDILKNKPPLAHITDMRICPEHEKDFIDFSISKSTTALFRSTLISPDMSTCDDCIRELFDHNDRRFRYPFTNCTNCGPRYTIIDDIPYDRPSTSMKNFIMCKKCQNEYDDPDDRRFHAQPNACEVCGPRLSLYDSDRGKIPADDPAFKTAELIKSGHIVAIKGLGGFHLAVDAQNSSAVSRLRQRKHRDEKPFALMSNDLKRITEYAYVDLEEETLLSSPQRPIVILKKRIPNSISNEVSPKNKFFGVMLPYTPLHYLLLNHDFLALVMTSGNLSEEPIAIDNDEAFQRLSDIADYFLIHNRDIYIRSDDSITRITDGVTRSIRRSRGYIPAPVFLKNSVPQILACGAELKNTICLTKENNAFLSQHIGDLENLATYDFFKTTISHMKNILDINPECIAYDFHPDYLSTRFALEQTDMQKVPIQHHHAHIAGCMAENRIDGPVIGLSFDGTGYGTDGNIWGGEVLIVDSSQFKRFAHLSYVPMPGSAAAIKEPWRMALSYLVDAFGSDFSHLEIPFLNNMEKGKIRIITEMISKKINSPLTSSMGRLFDGVSAILGVRNRVAFEGQAAMELEMLAHESPEGINLKRVYDFEWHPGGDGFEIPVRLIIRNVVADIGKGLLPTEISFKFHMTLIHLFSELCSAIRKDNGINRVVLSGGVFQNTILLNGLIHALEKNKFEVITHKQVPSNDGGISLGQAVVAANIIMDE